MSSNSIPSSVFQHLMVGGSFMGGNVEVAKEDMEKVPIPMRRIDIFDPEKIRSAKALFSDEYRRDPSPGFGYGFISRKVMYTLDGYWVDKHLSSRISTNFMEEALRRIEIAVKKQLYGPFEERRPPIGRELFYVGVLDKFGIRGDTYVDGVKKLNPEADFILRVVERLALDLQTQILKELPLPDLSDHENARGILARIPLMFSCKDRSSIDCLTELMDTPKAIDAYRDFCRKMFDLRDERLLKLLRENLTKDKLAREADPQTPLTHVVTLESYEKAIDMGRKKLYMKVATVLARCLSVFSFILRTSLQKSMERKILYFCESIHRVITWRPQRRLSFFRL